MSISTGKYKTRNLPINFNGETLTLKEWAAKIGVDYTLLWLRLYRYNMSKEEALTSEKYTPKQKTGNKSGHWIKDRTKLKTGRTQAYDGRYIEWMKQVKNRDKWKCRISNEDCSGRLEAHHILPWSQSPELRYEVNNGISLCHYHHPRKREEEKRLIPVFQEMVLRPIYELAIN